MSIGGFLRTVWGNQPQHNNPNYCISTKSMQDKWTDTFFEDIEDAIIYAEGMKNNHHVYFTPSIFSTDRRRKSCVMPGCLLYADLDEIHPSSCFVRPQIAWKTSANRYSCIWVLDRDIPVTEFEGINKEVSYRCNADPSGWDATQVLRLPSTYNFKYKEKPRVIVLWSKVTEAFPPDKFLAKLNPVTKLLLEKKDTSSCDRSAVLFKLEHDLKKQGFTREEVFDFVKDTAWNKYKGRKDWVDQLCSEIEKVFTENEGKSPLTKYEEAEPRLIKYTQIIEQEIQWLWKPYLPAGKLVLVEGDPAEGKSWFTSAVIAAISNGGTILDTKFEPGPSVILNAEDDPRDTIKPRLRKLGANFEQIYDIENVNGKVINFHDEADYIYMLGMLNMIRPKILVIDPLVAFVGDKIDINKAGQVRYIMARLRMLAESSGTTIIVVRHLAKTDRENILYRGLGSIDMSASVRSQLMIGKSLNDKYQKIMAQIKISVERTGMAVKYYLDSSGGFEWLGYIDFDTKQWAPVPLEKQKHQVRKAKQARARIMDDNVVQLHPKD